MGASSYGTGLIGTRELTNILGVIERIEGFGEGNETAQLNGPGGDGHGYLYDDSQG